MTRQTVLLRRIIGHFATPTQLKEYDTLVAKNKGSASHWAFRLIERYFEKKDKKENPERYRPTEEKSRERTLKINGRDGTSFISW